MVCEVLEELEKMVSRQDWKCRYDPMDELVSCILSQHSADAVSYPTFESLKKRYKKWEEVAHLSQSELQEIIRPAGLAGQKSRTILGALKHIKSAFGDYTLEPLRKMPLLEARQWLETIPGIGPKTATIVLCFSMGADMTPVDTHVYRVCQRLAIIPRGMTANHAHDHLLRVVPEGLAFRFHMACIAHGRGLCSARKPKCSSCLLNQRCHYARTH